MTPVLLDYGRGGPGPGGKEASGESESLGGWPAGGGNEWGDPTRHGGDETFRSREGGTSVMGTKEKGDLEGGRTGTRRQTAGRTGGFSSQSGAHGPGRPHLPGGRRDTAGEEDPDFPGQQRSRPRPWPSCASAERKPRLPSGRKWHL